MLACAIPFAGIEPVGGKIMSIWSGTPPVDERLACGLASCKDCASVK